MLPVVLVLVAVSVIGVTFAARRSTRRRSQVGEEIAARRDAARAFEEAVATLTDARRRGEIDYDQALAELAENFPLLYDGAHALRLALHGEEACRRLAHAASAPGATVASLRALVPGFDDGEYRDALGAASAAAPEPVL